MNPSIKLFGLFEQNNQERTYPKMVATHNYKDAILHFLKIIKRKIFSRYNIEFYISTFFYEYEGDDKPKLKHKWDYPLSASVYSPEKDNDFQNMKDEDRLTLFHWVLEKWGMEPCRVGFDFLQEGELERLMPINIYTIPEDHEYPNDRFYSSFSEEFFGLPEEKQVELGNLFIDWIGFYISSKPITEAIDGLDQLMKSHE